LSNWENSNRFSCDSERIVLWSEFSGKFACDESIKIVEAITLALIKYGPILIKSWASWKSFKSIESVCDIVILFGASSNFLGLKKRIKLCTTINGLANANSSLL
jgi:hypothetical protein